jgi:dGTPase
MRNMIEDSILKSRQIPRSSDDVRSPYYRDTTAIIHSMPFRRLKHKTQVFFAPSNDHICTRMEHVLHVASIATAICRAMGLDDELAWAIGMGHDLGHTPFGHIGEKIISSMMQEKGLGCFEHEVNSLRVVDFLSPLNLTLAVRDGIVSHCGEAVNRTVSPDFRIKDFDSITTRRGLRPATWEGCVVRVSDQIAYLGRDFEDACRLGIVKPDQLPEICKNVLGSTNSDIINSLVLDVITNSQAEGAIGYSENVFEAVKTMMEFNVKYIYRSDALNGYEQYFRRLMRLIYDYLTNLMERCGQNRALYEAERNKLATAFYQYYTEKEQSYLEHDGNLDRLVFDYIAGMSDNFCLDARNEILKPEYLDRAIEDLK